MLLVLPTSCPFIDTLLTVSTPSNHNSTYCLLNMSGVTIKYTIIYQHNENDYTSRHV